LHILSQDAALLAAFAFVCTAAIVDKANFSGDWTLNEQKSDLGQFGTRFTPKKFKV
jgi:hypothetical protein